MTMGTVNIGKPLSAKEIARQYYRDVSQLLLGPGSFFEAVPSSKSRWDTLVFLGLTSLIYTVLATIFTPVQKSIYFFFYLINALLMPLITALVLNPVLRILCPGRYSRNLLFKVTAYANGVLVLAWIPGIAPWVEILKYGLIGLGLVKTGGISGWRALGAMTATIFLLVLMLYCLQYLMRF